MYRWGYWLTVGVLAGLISGYTIVGLTVPYFNNEFRNPAETGEFLYLELQGGEPDILDELPWREYDESPHDCIDVYRLLNEARKNETLSADFTRIVLYYLPIWEEDFLEVLIDDASDEEKAYITEYINSFGYTEIKFTDSPVSKEYHKKYLGYLSRIFDADYYRIAYPLSDGRIVICVEPFNRGSINRALRDLDGYIPPGLLVFRQNPWDQTIFLGCRWCIL